MSSDQQQQIDVAERPSSGKHRATRVWLVAFLCASAVYLPTTAPGLLWGDSGDAQVRVVAGRLTDPTVAPYVSWGSDEREHNDVGPARPGKPHGLARAHVTYYAVAIALQRGLRLEPALAANLTSALAGAATIANFAWLLSLFVRRRWTLVSGVALLLFSHTLWQLSTGAEVVTSSTMCLSLELTAVVLFARTRHGRWLALAAFANGFGWSTHNFAMLTWPAYVVVAVLRWKKLGAVSWKTLVFAAGAWLFGCVPLIVLAGLEYARVGSLVETARSVVVGGYQEQALNVTISSGSLIRLAAYVVLNFPTPLILLAPWGWWRTRRITTPATWWFLTITGVVLLAFAARYNVPDQYTFFVHSYILLVLFAAVGVDRWLDRHPSRRMTAVVIFLSLLAPVVYAVAPPVARRCTAASRFMPSREIPYRDSYAWFLRPWRTGYIGAERYAREVFKVLPPDAVLLVNTTMRRPFDYLQGRHALRLDVDIPRGLYRWRDQPPPREVNRATARHYSEKGLLFTANPDRPYIPRWVVEGGYRLKRVGHVYRVDPPKNAMTRD